MTASGQMGMSMRRTLGRDHSYGGKFAISLANTKQERR